MGMLGITIEQFDSLLTWLGGGDRDLGAGKYEVIRAGLVRVFISKGFNDAEDLADETINRVITRLPDIHETYEGEPARYFHGVARNIVRETGRRREVSTEAPAVWVDPRPTNQDLDCLEQCLQSLTTEKRDLVLDYFLYEGHDKIEHHKQMAAEFGITEGALRGRVHHIRVNLVDCMRQCVGGKRITKLHPKAMVRRGAIGGGTSSVNTETFS